jgi:hypothetical protein
MLSEGAIQLRAWINKRFDTQAEAAEFFGFHESELSYFLNGHRLPDRDKAVVIQDKTTILVSSWSLTPDNRPRVLVSSGRSKANNNKA